MKLLPQPNYSVGKENFKNRLRWSHDIVLRVQRSLTLWKCKCYLIYISRCKSVMLKSQIIKLPITHLLISLAQRQKNCWTPCLFATISRQVKNVL